MSDILSSHARLFVFIRWFAIGALLLLLTACSIFRVYYGRLWQPKPTLVLASHISFPSFPLQIRPGERYLRDSQGKPFLLHGDTAWSLIADLTREEVDIYLADRRARGFNTLLVNLLEHKFARNAPRNIYGEAPFTDPDNFSAPNEAYFAHAEWVLRRARDMGFLVLLAPAYTGWVGGDEGWWDAMARHGSEMLHAYGRFLGTRFGSLDNIVWVNGGDDDPPNKSLVEAVAKGLKETAPTHLRTVHDRRDTPVREFWRNADWLDIVSVYTWEPVCERTAAAYANPAPSPVFLIESVYENEHGADPRRVRLQAYQAILCGASGQIFGNNPIWHFGHQGLFTAPADWWQSLGSGGAVSMTRMANIFLSLPWWTLEPDLDGALLVGGQGEGFDRAVAARSTDRKLAVIYVPTRREIEISLGSLSDGVKKMLWIDPVSGAISEPEGRAGSESGRVRLTPPGQNAGGDGDWVLKLSVSAP
jgi:hypothetical protein